MYGLVKGVGFRGWALMVQGTSNWLECEANDPRFNIMEALVDLRTQNPNHN